MAYSHKIWLKNFSDAYKNTDKSFGGNHTVFLDVYTGSSVKNSNWLGDVSVSRQIFKLNLEDELKLKQEDFHELKRDETITQISFCIFNLSIDGRTIKQNIHAVPIKNPNSVGCLIETRTKNFIHSRQDAFKFYKTNSIQSILQWT